MITAMKIVIDRVAEIVPVTDVDRETEMMTGITVAEAARGITEAGEMTPAIGLGGGQTILLT